MILILMGVSGCGKTTVGKLLAARLGWAFYDGDDFHPRANKDKMARGVPLDDDDRAGWLAALADLIREELHKGKSAVLACSALKERYRQELCVDPDQVRLVYLKGSYQQILRRMASRSDHYMKPGMLQSQFEALEEPREALTVGIDATPQAIVAQVLQKLRLSR
jgi:gluconokinase